jgi:hypothetical protein
MNYDADVLSDSDVVTVIAASFESVKREISFMTPSYVLSARHGPNNTQFDQHF